MDPMMTFLDCPAWLDDTGAARCGLPAEVRSRYIATSTDGPLESAMIRCPIGHWFNGPIEFLTLAPQHKASVLPVIVDTATPVSYRGQVDET